MTQHILILSVSAGAGHVRAAQALELALREIAPNAHIENMDVLELTNSAFRRVYGQSYLDLVNHAPHVLGYIYDLFDRPSRTGKHRGDKFRLALEKLNLRKFMRLLQRQPWDLAISTHFLPAEIIAALRRDGRVQFPQATVTTDFETHRLWVNQPCEHYFTATEEGSEYLRYWGVPNEDISLTGIPIHPAFCVPKERNALKQKYGLDEHRPVVLQLAGGFGVGPIAQLYRALLNVPVPIQVVVITGRNEKARQQLESIAVPSQHSGRIVGYTTEIDEWMRMSDLVVSKPGGLTTSETLAAGAVMVIINPIPGQETRNNDFLLENGAAIKSSTVGVLTYKITTLLRDPQRLAQLKAGVARLARPQAAYAIAEQSLALIGQPIRQFKPRQRSSVETPP